MDEYEFKEYKFIARGFKNVVVLKYFLKTDLWFAYYEHEANHLITYDGSGKTAEEAIDKFIRYRIDGEYQEQIRFIGNWTAHAEF